jgi:hypothetical protein
MAFASGMQRDIAVISEVTYGTTPATPAFKYARVLEGSGMNATKATEVIRQLTSHSNPIDLIELGQDASGNYTLVPSYGDAFESIMLAAIRRSSFTTNTAWNGRDAISMSIEEKITGTAANYLRYTGVEVESFDINVTARQFMQSSVQVQGKQAAIATTAITGATYTAANTEEVYTALSVANLAVQSLSPAPSVRSITASIKHAMSPVNVLGSKYRSGTTFDQIDVTGQVETIFEDSAAYTAFLNHTSGALTFTVGTVTAKKYKFTFPKVYFQEGTVSQTGNGPVLVTLGYTAVYDGTNGTVKIEKAVA